MSKPSPEYLSKVETCFRNNITLAHANMTTVQKFRTQIVYEAFQFWLNDKDIRPMQLLSRIAARDYDIILNKADSGDELSQAQVKDLNIRPGVGRSINELSNDVYVLNWFINRYTPDTTAIEKARDKESISWIITEGKKCGDRTAVANGVKMSMTINDNYKEKDNAADQIPNTLINISGDVSIVRSNDSNYTEEEKKALRDKFGVTEKDILEFKENENGIMEAVDDDDAEEKDIFIEKEGE
jgi:hypothetical protein